MSELTSAGHSAEHQAGHSAEHQAGHSAEHQVTVRYWAAARAAAGLESETVNAATLGEAIDEIYRRHRDRDRFADVIDACAVLVGEVPVGSRHPDEVLLADGDQIEFLPPFAGGA